MMMLNRTMSSANTIVISWAGVGSEVGNAVAGDAVVGESDVGDAEVGEVVVGETEVGEVVVGDAKVGGAVVGEPEVGGSVVGVTDVGEVDVGEADDGAVVVLSVQATAQHAASQRPMYTSLQHWPFAATTPHSASSSEFEPPHDGDTDGTGVVGAAEVGSKVAGDCVGATLTGADVVGEPVSAHSSAFAMFGQEQCVLLSPHRHRSTSAPLLRSHFFIRLALDQRPRVLIGIGLLS